MKGKIFLTWLLPLILFGVCGYEFINAVWIYVSAADKLQRLDGYVCLILGIMHGVLFLIVSAIATVLTVLVCKKKRNKDTERI